MNTNRFMMKKFEEKNNKIIDNELVKDAIKKYEVKDEEEKSDNKYIEESLEHEEFKDDEEFETEEEFDEESEFYDNDENTQEFKEDVDESVEEKKYRYSNMSKIELIDLIMLNEMRINKYKETIDELTNENISLSNGYKGNTKFIGKDEKRKELLRKKSNELYEKLETVFRMIISGRDNDYFKKNRNNMNNIFVKAVELRRNIYWENESEICKSNISFLEEELKFILKNINSEKVSYNLNEILNILKEIKEFL